MTRHSLVAGLVVVTLVTLPSVVGAQALFTAVTNGSANEFCIVHGAGGIQSLSPVSTEIVCAVPGPGGGSADAYAYALPGHVGAKGSAAKPTGGNDVPMQGSATAILADQVEFSPLPGVPGVNDIPVRLTLDYSGRMRVGAFLSSASVRGCVIVAANRRCFQIVELNDGTSNTGFNTTDFTVLNASFIQTPEILVPVGRPVEFQLFLEVEAFARRDGSAMSDFSNSLALPTGMDVFVLPPGFTVNAPGSFLFDNRFFPGGFPTVVAKAGNDLTVDEEAVVSLDGSASEGQNLSFSWSQLAGPPVELGSTTSATPSFTAPVLPGGFGAQTLTFELTVSEGSQTSTDTVDVVVRNVNHGPVSDAGTDQTVAEGSPVTLDGRASFDPDGDEVAYAWEQTGGTPAALDLTDPARPTFTAPLLSGGAGGSATLAFALTVSDGSQSSTDDVQVVVDQVNHAPAADAGIDQTTNEGSQVALDGRASSDPDSDPLTHSWTQMGGTAVTLSSAHSATPGFTAPPVGPGGDTLVFQLVVSDGSAPSSPDHVIVTVQNVNDPPRCDLARASTAVLWPPNHKLIPVGVVGVTEPDDDQVTITVDAATQDEPVNGVDDGDTSPDAVRQGQGVLLRSERSGSGNGRIYQVSFTASDSRGGTCSGSITVGVPQSMRPGAPIIDDGQLHDSLQP